MGRRDLLCCGQSKNNGGGRGALRREIWAAWGRDLKRKERVMEEGVVGIYMGPEATENLQRYLTNLIRKRDRVGVKEIRLDVGDDDVIAGVIDGARMSVEGREVGYCWAAVCCTRGREEMGSGWSGWPRPFFFFFLYENKHFLFSVFFYKFRFRPPIQVK